MLTALAVAWLHLLPRLRQIIQQDLRLYGEEPALVVLDTARGIDHSRRCKDIKPILLPGLGLKVGCVHSFQATGATVRWLESQAPQMPPRHAYRFVRDWEYLSEQLKEEK